MHILVLRFSAFGDVAMTIPVLWAVAHRYPQYRFTLVSRESMRPLFLRMPDNVAFHGVNLKEKRYKGIFGMVRLYRELERDLHFDVVADLHDVLRTKILRVCALLDGKRVKSVDKGKEGKRRLVRSQNKVLCQLPTSFDNYSKVFAALGMPVPTLEFPGIYGRERGDFSRVQEFLPPRRDGEKWVGIAPFAAHQGKVYPLHLMEQVVSLLGQKTGVRVFLFGAGDKELSVLRQWASKYPQVTLPEGLRMERELILMSHLDVMISMDSANMHLASLVNTPVLSIWGATHPYAGFMGYGQSLENAIQVEGLECRPCSVFGNKPCLRGDYACLNGISPQHIVDRVWQVITCQ